MAAPASLCVDTSEAIDLFKPQGLYLKPIARIHVSVQLPQLKVPGKSISNWEVMEKVKSMIRPDVFSSLKVVKSSLEFIRFEGELENKGLIPTLLHRLDCNTIKLSGFPDILKVRAAEAKVQFPGKHDWESFFRDASDMNEMKPGERPDTLHLQGIPIRWFAANEEDTPSEYVVKKVFENFGAIRCVDIPILDPYRKQLASSTFSFGQGLVFEAYVQYKEYISFVKAMDVLRGMKLLYQGADKRAWTACIKVDYDKSKHLSDRSIRRRRLEREQLQKLEKEREEKKRKEREEKLKREAEEKARVEAEEAAKEKRREERAEKRKQRQLAREEKRAAKRKEKKKQEEEDRMQRKIALEERKILIARRKLESIRLLTEVISRVKGEQEKLEVERREAELEAEQQRRVQEQNERHLQQLKHKAEQEKRRKAVLSMREHEMRSRMVRNLREAEERKAEEQRETLRKRLSAAGAGLKSAVVSSTVASKRQMRDAPCLRDDDTVRTVKLMKK